MPMRTRSIDGTEVGFIAASVNHSRASGEKPKNAECQMCTTIQRLSQQNALVSHWTILRDQSRFRSNHAKLEWSTNRWRPSAMSEP
jgi:hypothetical protein